jgi:hypothetical protein
MGPVTHQTIRLSKGKHTSKDHGACVMELASMLAGEPFSDHPSSVCPVIGSVLRAYNDSIDDTRRQDLYAYAAKVVDTRAPADVEQRRIEQVTAWMYNPDSRRFRFRLPARLRAVSPRPPLDVLAASAVRSLRTHDDCTHAQMLALVDSLIAMGRRAPTVPDAAAAPTRDRSAGAPEHSHAG